MLVPHAPCIYSFLYLSHLYCPYVLPLSPFSFSHFTFLSLSFSYLTRTPAFPYYLYLYSFLSPLLLLFRSALSLLLLWFFPLSSLLQYCFRLLTLPYYLHLHSSFSPLLLISPPLSLVLPCLSSLLQFCFNFPFVFRLSIVPLSLLLLLSSSSHPHSSLALPSLSHLSSSNALTSLFVFYPYIGPIIFILTYLLFSSSSFFSGSSLSLISRPVLF